MLISKKKRIKDVLENIGKSIVLNGWVDSIRDHGKLAFVDLRDRTGIVQCVFADFDKKNIKPESVLRVKGVVKKRDKNNINEKILTGEVEVVVESFKVLNKCKELPIPIHTDGKEIEETVRLKYRYLDLRRERMRNILKLRSEFAKAIREAFYELDFIEVETPLLTKSTKEGARDFIIPSRLQKGKFYALPQSPQQYKQLLMTAGVERYFQFARCIRDEDLRADRGFEFTQVDVEMSFVEQKDVMDTIEYVIKKAVKKVGGKIKQDPFPVIDYKEALKKYGADKFDLRTEEEKKQGVLAFAWVVNFPFFKKVDKDDAAEMADSKSGWTFTHNPFSAPKPEFLEDHLKGQNIENILTAQYDLVCNGYEVGGGSIRAHTPEILKATYKIMGYSDEEIEESVGHMLKAFEYGTPPHGGLAYGFDRLVMLLANEDSLKETIAFPMTSSGKTAVMDAPSEVSEDQLKELGIKVVGQDESTHDKVLSLLEEKGVSFKYLSHVPVKTSEEASKVRNTPLEMGAKALLLKTKNEFFLLVISAAYNADLKKLREQINSSKIKLASVEDVKNITNVEPGAVPPFGSLFSIKTYIDKTLLDKDEIVFNVGRHNRSVIMKLKDYLSIEKPIEVDVKK